MPGRGPAPKGHTQRPRDAKRRARGDFRKSEAIGWQYGEIPDPPADVSPATLEAWREWFSGWVSAHWIPGDVPQLRQMARLYDAVERGKLTRAPELRYWLDTYGLTPKGQQDRRWTPPDDVPLPVDQRVKRLDRYAHLRQLGDEE